MVVDHKMNTLTLTLVSLLAAAKAATVSFRGLDGRYMVQPHALYFLRNAFACHYGVPVAAVQIEAVSWYNVTSTVKPDYGVNDYAPAQPIPCALFAATHWDGVAEDHLPEEEYLGLYRALADQEPVTVSVSLDVPIGWTRPYKLNLLPYLAAAVDEEFAPVLHSQPQLFTEVGPLPKTSRPSALRLLGLLDLKVMILGIIVLHFGGAMGLICLAQARMKNREYQLPDKYLVPEVVIV